MKDKILTKLRKHKIIGTIIAIPLFFIYYFLYIQLQILFFPELEGKLFDIYMYAGIYI